MDSEVAKVVAPERSALLVVDVQNDFVHSQGEMARSGKDVAFCQQMVPTLVDFISVARQLHLPIMYTQATHSIWTDTPNWRSRHKGKRDTDHFCRPNTWGWEFYTVAPRADELVVMKPRWNSFIGTPLELSLRARGARCILATGVATGGCVEATVMHAAMLDFEVVILDDCTADLSVESHKEAMDRMARLAVISSSTEVKQAWAGALVKP
ncbi:MAG: cysteine hydrolase [Chloroflexi bacterium]|nr:cysteine hydrolase [Chloroflexota bacterium]